MDEVHYTIETGYGVVELFEFWECELRYVKRDTNAGGLFAEHINVFLKLKQESSGYPSRVLSVEQNEK